MIWQSRGRAWDYSKRHDLLRSERAILSIAAGNQLLHLIWLEVLLGSDGCWIVEGISWLRDEMVSETRGMNQCYDSMIVVRLCAQRKLSVCEVVSDGRRWFILNISQNLNSHYDPDFLRQKFIALLGF
jgi:hypothetical protein